MQNLIIFLIYISCIRNGMDIIRITRNVADSVSNSHVFIKISKSSFLFINNLFIVKTKSQSVLF